MHTCLFNSWHCCQNFSFFAVMYIGIINNCEVNNGKRWHWLSLCCTSLHLDDDKLFILIIFIYLLVLIPFNILMYQQTFCQLDWEIEIHSAQWICRRANINLNKMKIKPASSSPYLLNLWLSKWNSLTNRIPYFGPMLSCSH